MDKSKICFVRAKYHGGDYVYDAIDSMGYDICIPYYDLNLLLRCAREIWFRFKLPFKNIWFNRALLKKNADVYIVKDPLIVPEFLSWLRKAHSNSRIILDYDNRVSMSLNPNLISDDIVEKWSYDQDDCEKYGMKQKPSAYLDIYQVVPYEKKDLDILYLGRDKGRAEYLLSLEKDLTDLGLRTYFHICADRSFLRFKKTFYKPVMPYLDYLEMLKGSKAILNIVQPNQTSLTLRDYEAVFDNVKCITNNPAIKEFELYHPSRYFVLGEDSLNELLDFLSTPFKPVDSKILSKYSFDSMVEEMIGGMTK